MITLKPNKPGVGMGRRVVITTGEWKGHAGRIIGAAGRCVREANCAIFLDSGEIVTGIKLRTLVDEADCERT